jgi:hypothetical protein
VDRAPTPAWLTFGYPLLWNVGVRFAEAVDPRGKVPYEWDDEFKHSKAKLLLVHTIIEKSQRYSRQAILGRAITLQSNRRSHSFTWPDARPDLFLRNSTPILLFTPEFN